MKWNCWWSLVVVPNCLAWCRCMSALFSSPTSFALPYAHWAMHFILYTHLPLYLSQCIFASRLDSSSDAMGTTRTRPVACLPTRRAARPTAKGVPKPKCIAMQSRFCWCGSGSSPVEYIYSRFVGSMLQRLGDAIILCLISAQILSILLEYANASSRWLPDVNWKIQFCANIKVFIWFP